MYELSRQYVHYNLTRNWGNRLVPKAVGIALAVSSNRLAKASPELQAATSGYVTLSACSSSSHAPLVHQANPSPMPIPGFERCHIALLLKLPQQRFDQQFFFLVRAPQMAVQTCRWQSPATGM